MALASPLMDVVGLEPCTPAGTSGALVTQVWKASCQALGPALEQALLSGAGPALQPVVTTLFSCAALSIANQNQPPYPSLRIRAWLEGAGLVSSSDNWGH